MILRISVLVGSLLLLLSSMASAQVVQRVAVTVPFAFVVGSSSLPAGDYSFELNREGNRMILRSEDGSERNALMLVTNSLGADPGKSYAAFHRYGSHYFLAEVWRQGSGQSITPGDLERKLASKQATWELARVEARVSGR